LLSQSRYESGAYHLPTMVCGAIVPSGFTHADTVILSVKSRALSYAISARSSTPSKTPAEP